MVKKLIELPFQSKLASNLSLNNKLLQVVLGPRQVGKTTSVLRLLEEKFANDYHYVSADGNFHSTGQWIIENWNAAFREKKILVIDEIQKCENWSETIKMLWDEYKKQERSDFQCVLLGSSSLKLHQGLSESLTGRFQLILAYHWNYRESKEGYGLNFEEYLQIGGYPGTYPFAKDHIEWANYLKNSIISTIIEKDILVNQTVKSPALFRQAFELLISYPAQEISFTKLLGQLQDRGNVELIKHYIHLFEEAYLIKTLSKYSTRAIVQKSSSPKILPLAPSFYYLNHLGSYDSEERGRVFELVVGIQLVRTECDLFYWRNGNDEVDYILKRGKSIWAIEVKSGRKKNTKGLLKFKELVPQAKLVVITPQNYEDFECDPMAFLKTL